VVHFDWPPTKLLSLFGTLYLRTKDAVGSFVSLLKGESILEDGYKSVTGGLFGLSNT